MSLESIFTIISNIILPFWLLLLFAPHAKVTKVLVHTGLIPAVYAIVYTYYLITGLFLGMPEGGGMGSLEALMIAFTEPNAVIAGWTHYLVFDLFIGAWIVRDAKRESIHHLAVVIPLVLTFVAGPLGLFVYLIIRGGLKRKFSLAETTVTT